MSRLRMIIFNAFILGSLPAGWAAYAMVGQLIVPKYNEKLYRI